MDAGEYLSDIRDVYEVGAVFETGVEAFTTDCYDDDWFDTFNDEVGFARVFLLGKKSRLLT